MLQLAIPFSVPARRGILHASDMRATSNADASEMRATSNAVHPKCRSSWTNGGQPIILLIMSTEMIEQLR